MRVNKLMLMINFLYFLSSIIYVDGVIVGQMQSSIIVKNREKCTNKSIKIATVIFKFKYKCQTLLSLINVPKGWNNAN